MFKNCKKSVCSTSSTHVERNPKKVTVLHHSISNTAAGSQFSNQGTNLWLKNGGVLPLVAVGDTFCAISKGGSTDHKPVKQLTKTPKAQAVTKQTKELQARHTIKRPVHRKGNSQTQASLKPFNSTYTLEKNCREKQIKEEEEQFVFDKENYVNIISHFNERDCLDVYNPAEYCEMRHKNIPSTPCTDRLPQTTTASEEIHYSMKAKAEILLSIQEELKSWRNEDLND